MSNKLISQFLLFRGLSSALKEKKNIELKKDKASHMCFHVFGIQLLNFSG